MQDSNLRASAWQMPAALSARSKLLCVDLANEPTTGIFAGANPRRKFSVLPALTKKKVPQMRDFFLGTPGKIRTYDLWLRKPTLYPAELQVHVAAYFSRSLNQKVHPVTAQ